MAARALAAAGAFYDPSDATSLYQSRTGGTTGATGQPVGIMLDKSYMGSAVAATFIASQPDLVVNGSFAADATWTKGAGWTIAGGVGVGTASSADLSQAAVLTVGSWYAITFDVVVTSGTLTPKAGSGTAGTAVSATGTYTQILRAATTTALIFTGAAFTGTIDNVSVKVIPGFHALAPSDAARPVLTIAGSIAYLTADGVDDWMQVFPTLNLGSAWTHVGGWLASATATSAFSTTNTNNGRLRGHAAGTPIWRMRNTADTADDFIASGGDATLAHVASVEKTSATSVTGRMNGQFPLTIGVTDVSGATQGLALFTTNNTVWLAGLNGRFYGGAWLPANISPYDRAAAVRFMSRRTGLIQ